MPVNPYDDRKVSLRRPHGNGDLDIVRASYTRRKANVTEALAIVLVSIGETLLVSMTLASTVAKSCVFKWSNIAFQYTRSLTDQPRPSKFSNCLCLNRLNINSKYDFVFKGC